MHIFISRITPDVIRKQLTLSRADEVLVQPAVQHKSSTDPLHSELGKNVFEKTGNHIKSSTIRNNFKNKLHREEKLPFVRTVQD